MSELHIHICHHILVPASGVVEYQRGPIGNEPQMRVICLKCNRGGWMTQQQWESVDEAGGRRMSDIAQWLEDYEADSPHTEKEDMAAALLRQQAEEIARLTRNYQHTYEELQVVRASREQMAEEVERLKAEVERLKQYAPLAERHADHAARVKRLNEGGPHE